MEFLLVIYPSEREVLIDDVVAGLTNHIITLAPGSYTISLNGARAFTPPVQDVLVEGTSPLDPKEITFV
jgi:hypothetical protein